MCVIRQARESQPREANRALAREVSGFYFLLSLRFAVLHEVEFPTCLLLDKVGGLYFLLPNILETEFLHV